MNKLQVQVQQNAFLFMLGICALFDWNGLINQFDNSTLIRQSKKIQP